MNPLLRGLQRHIFRPRASTCRVVLLSVFIAGWFPASVSAQDPDYSSASVTIGFAPSGDISVGRSATIGFQAAGDISVGRSVTIAFQAAGGDSVGRGVTIAFQNATTTTNGGDAVTIGFSAPVTPAALLGRAPN